MTPEQEKKLDLVLGEVGAIKSAVTTLAQRLIDHEAHDDKRYARHEDMLGRLRGKWREMKEWFLASRPSRPGREPMPTLNPDDSGSIELKAFGQEAAFRGKTPVRVAVMLLAITGLVAMGALLHSSLVRSVSASQVSAPVAGERK